jgi:hypothetical protein
MSQTIPVIYKSQNESDSSKRVAAEAGGRNELLPLPDGELIPLSQFVRKNPFVTPLLFPVDFSGGLFYSGIRQREPVKMLQSVLF